MIDKVKKVIYIIVGALTIMSLVFSLAKKVGFCADSSQDPISFNPPPLLYGPGIGGYDSVDHSVVLQCLDYAVSHSPNYSGYTWLCVPYFISGQYYQRIAVMCVADNVSLLDFTSNFIVDYIISYDFYINGNYNTSVNNGRFTIQVANVYENVAGDNIYKVSNAHYPVWVYNPDHFNNSNGQQIFAEIGSDSPEVPGGHTKGGNITDYVPIDDSDVDVSSVTPSSSNTGNFLQKITNILQNLLKSTQNGFTNIVDNLKNFWNPILGWFEETFSSLFDKLDSFFSWVTEPLDQSVIMGIIQPALANNPLVQGFLSCKSSIQGVYTSIQGVSAKPSSALVFSIPFNLPSLSTTFQADIHFDWYENIRDRVEPFLNMVLVAGFLLSLIRSIPGILHGNSAEGDS